MSGFRWTPELHERADRLLADGCSFREVARTLGCHYMTVNNRFPGRGWTYRQAGAFRAATRDYSPARS